MLSNDPNESQAPQLGDAKPGQPSATVLDPRCSHRGGLHGDRHDQRPGG